METSEEMQLRHLIKKLLIHIAESSQPSGPVYPNTRSRAMALKSRLLSLFDQCAEFPMLVFDLERHTVDQWVKLSSSAIRCTLAPCKRGFVFVDWSWNKDAHATVFYFDGDRQYFFDPSGALEDVEDSEGVGIHEYFQSNHMWIPLSGLSDRRSQLQCVATALLAGEDQSIFACISSGKANML